MKVCRQTVVTMYLFLFLFLSVFCFVTGSSNYPVRKVVRTDSGSTKSYIIDDGGYSFYDGKEWCDKIKESLPVIKTRHFCFSSSYPSVIDDLTAAEYEKASFM